MVKPRHREAMWVSQSQRAINRGDRFNSSGVADRLRFEPRWPLFPLLFSLPLDRHCKVHNTSSTHHWPLPLNPSPRIPSPWSWPSPQAPPELWLAGSQLTLCGKSCEVKSVIVTEVGSTEKQRTPLWQWCPDGSMQKNHLDIGQCRFTGLG